VHVQNTTATSICIHSTFFDSHLSASRSGLEIFAADTHHLCLSTTPPTCVLCMDASNLSDTHLMCFSSRQLQLTTCTPMNPHETKSESCQTRTSLETRANLCDTHFFCKSFRTRKVCEQTCNSRKSNQLL